MACKLCGGETVFKFTKRLLKKFDASYWQCESCGSLQVADTAHLAEAYASQNWALDTGLVARNLLIAGQLPYLFDGLVGKSDLIVDYGGGTGLLTRLLRDMGYNAVAYDKFGKPLFVDAFHISSMDGVKCKVLLASEVLEHFDHPKEEIAVMLGATDLLVFTTDLYQGQGEDWHYLAPFTGQHVFFWSKKALETTFAAHDCVFADMGFFKVGVRKHLLADPRVPEKLNDFARIVRTLSISGSYLRPMKDYLAAPFKFVGPDYQAEIEKYYRD